MNIFNKAIKMFLLSFLIMSLLVMIILGFLLGFQHPLPWILIIFLIVIAYIHNRFYSKVLQAKRGNQAQSPVRFELYKKILRRHVIFGATVGAAIFFMLIGVIYWGVFHTVLEKTNNMEFCISCHEMENNVYQEYKTTIHYKNRVGVRAACPDCHVPKEWEHMMVRKINASKELYHKLLGSIDTQEKFENKRLQMAKSVWQSMQQTDSRECRNCHNFEAMDISTQAKRSGLIHQHAQLRHKTCIDCHKGIAHHLPDGVLAYKGGNDDDHEYYEQQKLECHQCHIDMPKVDTDEWEF